MKIRAGLEEAATIGTPEAANDALRSDPQRSTEDIARCGVQLSRGLFHRGRNGEAL